MISHPQRIGVGLLCLLPAIARGQDFQLTTRGEVIQGPATGEDNAAWVRAMEQWRRERRAEIRYDGSQYDRPELAWARRSFIQPQVMVEERYLYDPVAGKYTVDRYLDDLESRYGGIDSVLLWPVYPNIGIDNRNQHDLLRDMPGGLSGVRQMVADFHRRGVRVLFPVMPWDVGTRPEGVPLWVAAARDMKAIGADGINGVGYESWKNVWGIWNGFTPRDAEALRRISAIERAVADMLNLRHQPKVLRLRRTPR